MHVDKVDAEGKNPEVNFYVRTVIIKIQAEFPVSDDEAELEIDESVEKEATDFFVGTSNKFTVG